MGPDMGHIKQYLLFLADRCTVYGCPPCGAWCASEAAPAAAGITETLRFPMVSTWIPTRIRHRLLELQAGVAALTNGQFNTHGRQLLQEVRSHQRVVGAGRGAEPILNGRALRVVARNNPCDAW